MRKLAAAAMAVGILAIGSGLFAQEEDGGKVKGKREGKTGVGHTVMRDMMAIRLMFASVAKDIAPEFDAAQQAKFQELSQKLADKMKAAKEEFETGLADILTGEQMEKFKQAKEAARERAAKGRGEGKKREKEGGAEE